MVERTKTFRLCLVVTQLRQTLPLFHLNETSSGGLEARASVEERLTVLIYLLLNSSAVRCKVEPLRSLVQQIDDQKLKPKHVAPLWLLRFKLFNLLSVIKQTDSPFWNSLDALTADCANRYGGKLTFPWIVLTTWVINRSLTDCSKVLS